LKEQYRQLIALQDLDIMIREVKDKSTSAELRNLGFKLTGLEELQKARIDLAKKIPTPLLNRYEKLLSHYSRAIVPVTGNQCLGCFVTLPTSFFSAVYRDELLTCESCGRMLYIP
jgi:predicted  nucleic acid-binding Zn-ribbon protein